MNVDYDDDVRTLMAAARRQLDDRDTIGRARRVLEGGAPFDRELWDDMRDGGWCGIALPEDVGGSAMGTVALCGLAEELGRSLAPTPFASSIYGFAQAAVLGGRPDLLRDIGSGALIGTLALSDGPGAPFAAPIGAGVADGRLTGTKLPVTDGMSADVAIVLTTSDTGPTLVVADLTHAGVRRTPVSTLDPTRPAARFDFDAVPIEPLGAPGDAIRRATAILERCAVPLAFEALGGADACLAKTVDYVRTRYAFGRPIGGYQAIKHRLADMYVKNEMARSIAYHAAWAADNDPAAFPRAAAAARIACGDAYWFAAKEAIQLHGGIGFTWEMDCHLYYRRALHLAAIAGPATWWKARLAGLLRQEAA